jgi:DNA-nicking Smr family endonuclease
MTRRRRARELSGEEIELWRHVTQDVAIRWRAAPAREEPSPPPVSRPAAEIEIKSAAPARRYEAAGYTPPVSTPKPKSAPLTPIERPVRQRLARGRLPIDAAIDLHGLRQDEAHHALRHFLARQQLAGARIVLVVTGKGLSGGEAGVLRRMTPHWLAAPDWRRLVSGFENAARGHGGDGAFYVRLRKPAAP